MAAFPHASVELPGLISSLNALVGKIVRLGIDAHYWDNIPRRLTVGGHMVRVGRFTDVNHKIGADHRLRRNRPVGTGG